MTNKEKSFIIDKTKRIPIIEFILFITLLVVCFTFTYYQYIGGEYTFAEIILFYDFFGIYWYFLLVSSICFLVWGGLVIRDLLMNRKDKLVFVGKILSTGFPLVCLWWLFNAPLSLGFIIILLICFLGFCLAIIQVIRAINVKRMAKED